MTARKQRGLTFTPYFSLGDALAKTVFTRRSSRITEPECDAPGTLS